MKKIIPIILFLLLLVGCKSKGLTKIINMEYKNGTFYKEVQEASLNLKEYITSDVSYKIYVNDIEITNISNYELSVGENLFTVKSDTNTLKLNFYYVCDLLVELRNESFILIDSFTINNLTPLSFDLIKEHLPVKEGYTYDNLVYEFVDNTLVEYKLGKTINKNQMLIIKEIPNSYNVNVHYFDTDKKVSYKFNEPLNLLNIEVEGYTFLGWYVNDQKIDENAVYHYNMGTDIYARYEKNSYEITYVYQDKTEKQKITYLDEVNLIEVSKDGYLFNGWLYEGKPLNIKEYTFTKDITLYASFTPKTYEIKYSNIENSFSQSVKFNEQITLYVPTKEGYEFVGWLYNGELIDIDTYIYTHDIELIASFIQLTKELNLETFDGICLNYGLIVNGQITLPTPTKEGYKFMYWTTDPYFVNKVESVNAKTYNNELLYAYYILDTEQFISNITFTLFNITGDPYHEIVLYDNTQSNFTSKYWLKIAIKKTNNKYYVSGIAENGVSISTLGEYDYVLCTYSGSMYYSLINNVDINIGDEVIFINDVTEHEKGSVLNVINFKKFDASENIPATKQYLEERYKNFTEVSSDIELITSYLNLPITWQSTIPVVISSTGKYNKPVITRTVTLRALYQDTLLYEFDVLVKGDQETSNALATGYIYTPYTITQNAMNKLDILYCAFLEINTNAEFTNLTSITNKIKNNILPKAKISGTKVVISINSGESGAFSAVSASPELREKLAKNVLQFIIDLELDGVDVDWETPTSSEATNFTLLMKSLYETVKSYNSDFLVTAAIGGGKWAPPKYDLPNSKNYLDYINLMTYSMAKSSGYYQNALYKSSSGSTLVSCSIEESIEIYNQLTVPNSKILIGIPYYTTVQTGCEGPGTKTGDGKSIWYNQLYTTYQLSDTMKEYFDYECGVPYRYDSVNKIFISFDNEQSIKMKCDYVNSLGLAGVMYWQYGQDVNDYLSNSIDKYINN